MYGTSLPILYFVNDVGNIYYHQNFAFNFPSMDHGFDRWSMVDGKQVRGGAGQNEAASQFHSSTILERN